MPARLNARTPTYRLHKPTGQDVVTLSGRDVYLGKYGTAESHEEYQRAIGEWIANPSAAIGAEISISEMLAAYLRFAETNYRKADRSTKEFGTRHEAAQGALWLIMREVRPCQDGVIAWWWDSG